MKQQDDRYDNVVNIDGSRYKEGKEVKKPNRGLIYKLTPEVIGAGILILIFIYLVINVLIYRSKKQVSVFDVQAQSIGYSTKFSGICLRNENLVNSEASGYLNYYIGNGCRVAKNGIVYSVDSSDKIYNSLSASYEDTKLSSDEISRVKNIIASRMRDYNGSDLSWVHGFENSINTIVYEMINDNVLASALEMRDSDSSSTGFVTYRSDKSGVISYYSDDYTGFTADNITADTFNASDKEMHNLRTAGLVAAGTPVYRICADDNWSVIVKVTEAFYVNNLEKRQATVYINNDNSPLSGDLRLFMTGSDYFAEISFDRYMTRFINDRFVNVEFDVKEDMGLKIPLSAIYKKGYYLVPLTMFVAAEGYNGYVLRKEVYDASTGVTDYVNIYPEKYYSDGYYAYIDMDGQLAEGDYLCNTETGERLKVGLVNYLEGVYNVNKGYYVFMRIEKLRSNNEYAIIKSNTPDGLRQYDHIALNASDAVDQELIY
ncbi:MAG: hypothetical protein K6G45_00500 [Lachnospiraceae bacterium]|nr:hypothetical protein [Lachnospiraceae bacterium]